MSPTNYYLLAAQQEPCKKKSNSKLEKKKKRQFSGKKPGERTISRKMTRQKSKRTRQRNERGDRKGESNDSPAILDRGRKNQTSLVSLWGPERWNLQQTNTNTLLLGDSGGVVNSLDFCPALLKSLGCFYFWCILSSQWKAVTVNFRILHCQP